MIGLCSKGRKKDKAAKTAIERRQAIRKRIEDKREAMELESKWKI